MFFDFFDEELIALGGAVCCVLLLVGRGEGSMDAGMGWKELAGGEMED